MKVVNSIQGYIKGVNPTATVVVFNTTDPRFDEFQIKTVRNSALLIAEIVNNGVFCVVLLNVKDEFNFFVMGKNHNKVTHSKKKSNAFFL